MVLRHIILTNYSDCCYVSYFMPSTTQVSFSWKLVDSKKWGEKAKVTQIFKPSNTHRIIYPNSRNVSEDVFCKDPFNENAKKEYIVSINPLLG